MTNRLEVESAIKQLPESEVRALANWLQDYLDEMWDRQIEMDEPIDIEVVRTEALRKLGRNIVNFSKIEGILKYLLSVSQIEGLSTSTRNPDGVTMWLNSLLYNVHSPLPPLIKRKLIAINSH